MMIAVLMKKSLQLVFTKKIKRGELKFPHIIDLSFTDCNEDSVSVPSSTNMLNKSNYQFSSDFQNEKISRFKRIKGWIIDRIFRFDDNRVS